MSVLSDSPESETDMLTLFEFNKLFQFLQDISSAFTVFESLFHDVTSVPVFACPCGLNFPQLS